MLLCAVTRWLKEYGHKQELNKYLTVRLPEPQKTAPVKIGVRYAGRCFDQHQPCACIAAVLAVMKEGRDCFGSVVAHCLASDYLPLPRANFI
jgi:hypothetical protein